MITSRIRRAARRAELSGSVRFQGVCGRGSARAPGVLTEGVPEAWREVSGRGGRRSGAAQGRQRGAASGSRSRSPGRLALVAVGGACGDWRAGGEVGSTLFFMLMREWGLSVFTLRREPPPFIHPHGPSRCHCSRPTRAFAPLRALGRGRGGGDDPRRAAAPAPLAKPLGGAGRLAGRTPGLGPPVVVKRRRVGRREREPRRARRRWWRLLLRVSLPALRRARETCCVRLRPTGRAGCGGPGGVAA